MNNELKPCPFCKHKELPVRLMKDGKPTGIVAHACYTLGIEIRVPEHIWNTRYKRTCHAVTETQTIYYEGGCEYEECYYCSECGDYWGDASGAYCPSCGAEVICKYD